MLKNTYVIFMGKQEYSEEEICNYIGKKFIQNQALCCTIKKENIVEITLRFKPLNGNDIRRWARPIPFPQIVKAQKDKLLQAVSV